MKSKFIYVITVFFLFCLTACKAQEEIHWMTLNEALQAQENFPKKIMLDVYTNWCGPCKMMDRITFTNQNLVNYVNEHFYAVKFDAEGDENINYKNKVFTNPNYTPSTRMRSRNAPHQFAMFLGIQAFPSIVFLGEDAGYLANFPGYRNAQQLEIYLKLMATDEYKYITNQYQMKQFERSFQSSF